MCSPSGGALHTACSLRGGKGGCKGLKRDWVQVTCNSSIVSMCVEQSFTCCCTFLMYIIKDFDQKLQRWGNNQGFESSDASCIMLFHAKHACKGFIQSKGMPRESR